MLSLKSLNLKGINFSESYDSFLKSDSKTQVLVGGGIGISALTLIYALNKLFGTDPLGRTRDLLGKFSKQEKKEKY